MRQYGAATVHHTNDFNEDFGERAVKGVRHGFTTLPVPRSGDELAVSHPPHKLEGAERSRKGLIDYIFVSHSKQGTLALGPKVEVGVSDIACGARRDGPLAVLVRSWYPGNGYVYDTMCHRLPYFKI